MVEDCIEHAAAKKQAAKKHSVTIQLNFDEELQSLEEWIKKPKYDEMFQYNLVYDVDQFFKCAEPKRRIQLSEGEE